MNGEQVIIIGAARSGTKFLRDKIAEDPAYNCIPYDINYVWRMFEPNRTDDVLDVTILNEIRQKKLRDTLYRLGGVGGSDNLGLVEKSVSNCLRIPFVDAVLPEAQYVHLIRDGRAVIESSLRMWEAPPDRISLLKKLKDLPFSQYGYLYWFALNYIKGRFKGRSGGEVWGPRYPGIYDDLKNMSLTEVVALQWSNCVEFSLRDLKNIPAERQIEIRYEALCEDNGEVERLCEFLKPADPEKLNSEIKSGFVSENINKWRIQLNSQQMEQIREHAGQTLKHLGYGD